MVRPSSNMIQLGSIMGCQCIMLMYETSSWQMQVQSNAFLIQIKPS
jgi:hypothetical protein